MTQVREAGFFSLSFVPAACGITLYVSVWSGDILKHLCVLWEPSGQSFGATGNFLCLACIILLDLIIPTIGYSRV